LALGETLEKQVLQDLRDRGWKAVPYGQGTWPEPLFKALKGVDTPLHHEPDILAVKDGVLVSVDAKNCKPKHLTSPNHSINCDALKATDEWWKGCVAHHYFVFHDGGTADIETIATHGEYREGGQGADGSDKSYMLLPRRHCVPFDEIFGKVAP
jgi:hypothetical protein